MLASVVFFLAARVIASVHRLCFMVFFAAAAVFVIFTKASHSQWHVTINITKSELLPALPFGSSFLLILFSLSPLSRLMQIGKLPSACLSFCLPPPSLQPWSSLWFVCVSVQMGLLVVFPSLLRLCLTSRLLTVVATSFCQPF